MTEHWAVLGIAIVGVYAVAVALKQTWGGSIQLFPTLGWLFLMAFPFLVEYASLDPLIRKIQAVAILVALLSFLASDLVSNSIASKRNKRKGDSNTGSIKIAWFLSLVFGCMTVSHLVWFAESVPILNLNEGNSDYESIHSSRAAFSRDSPLPAVLRYSLSFSVEIFGCSSVLIFIALKRYVTGGILFIWVVLYASASTAILPTALAMLTLLIGLAQLSSLVLRKKILRTTVVIALSTLVGIATISIAGPWSLLLSGHPNNNTPLNKIAQPDFSRAVIGDKNRAGTNTATKGRPPAVAYYADRLLYRVVFTPVEVSYRWYEYFHKYPLNEVSFGRAVHDSRSDRLIHPANAVGRWAFYERFPSRYLDSAHAFCSFDADAYSRFWAGRISTCDISTVYI